MPEEPETPPPSDEVTDPPIPPLEASPEFQQRTQEALGGPATQPPTFRPVGRAPQEVGPQARAFGPGVEKRPHNPAFDGPSPDLVASRKKVADLQGQLGRLRSALNLVAPATDAMDEVAADAVATAEIEMQGIDMPLIREFLLALETARDLDQA